MIIFSSEFNMQQQTLTRFILISCLSAIIFQSMTTVEGQLLDKLFSRNDNTLDNTDLQRELQQQQQQQQPSRIGSLLRDVMSVNVPVFYDMVRNGTSMGINVLSGLVKVERGEEAERSGLIGRRPLSVRVFGVPVYERGTRVRPLDSPSSTADKIPPQKTPESDDELPIDP